MLSDLRFGLLLTACWATLSCESQPKICYNDRSELSISGGVTMESFRWSIAGNDQGQHPNVLSELKWPRLTTALTELRFSYKAGRHILLLGEASFLPEFHGTVYDTDYAGDNRTQPDYTGRFRTNHGNATRIGVLSGYAFSSHSRLNFTALIGFAGEIQHYRVQAGDNSYAYDATGLNSTYRASMLGPVVRLLSSLRLGAKFRLRASFECQQLIYHAYADWNLVTSFQHPKSFEQLASGLRLGTAWQGSYLISNKLAAIANFELARLITDKGQDALFLSNGNIEKTQFNGASLMISGLQAGLSLAF